MSTSGSLAETSHLHWAVGLCSHNSARVRLPQGVYVVDVGRVRGVLEPAKPVTMPLEAAQHSVPGYRWGTKGGAKGEEGGCSKAG